MVELSWSTVRVTNHGFQVPTRGPGSRKRRYFFLLVLRERDDFRFGTFAPFSRASLSPMAIACFRLVTFRPEPLFSVPFFLRCIADFTVFDAPRPYFAMLSSQRYVTILVSIHVPPSGAWGPPRNLQEAPR
jgi:hypothetical protein